jgi:hypothetical protein
MLASAYLPSFADTQFRPQAFAAISHTLCSAENKGAFCDAGGIPALVRALMSKAAERDLAGHELLFEEAGANCCILLQSLAAIRLASSQVAHT